MSGYAWGPAVEQGPQWRPQFRRVVGSNCGQAPRARKPGSSCAPGIHSPERGAASWRARKAKFGSAGAPRREMIRDFGQRLPPRRSEGERKQRRRRAKETKRGMRGGEKSETGQSRGTRPLSAGLFGDGRRSITRSLAAWKGRRCRWSNRLARFRCERAPERGEPVSGGFAPTGRKRLSTAICGLADRGGLSRRRQRRRTVLY